MSKSEEQRVAGILSTLISKNLINNEMPSVDAFDVDYLAERLDKLREAFPEDFILNAVALKANPICGVLQVAADKGFGAECASICEVIHALSLGFPSEKVVYNSPVKRRS